MVSCHPRSWAVTLGVAALLCAATATALAQTQVVYVPAVRITSVEGADVYQAYCAQCHGPTGLGNGPAARAFNPVPANLTLITVREGEFDPRHVMHHVGTQLGERDPHMPDWPRVLRSVYGNDGRTQLAIRNVAVYVETLQR